ncbi:DUF4129 domain-containing protein [Actinomyces bowdenii]|uniref:DUF4129 domain-containing protein n=1 Tax=Actinomyces bowdenii TaxID=131109 RepID=A0A3P1UTJ5_9ACTO|nr:DUF4129 domain-containing protein [Actinomyces bowdenii]RRD24435.1 DUF4129 domain-containing protein [Actinomyces bowdenii]
MLGSLLPRIEVPATPQADEARQAAEIELSRPIYDQREGLLARLWAWLRSLLEDGQLVAGAPPWVSTAIMVLCAALIIAALVLILRLARRITLPAKAGTQGDALFGDDRDSEDLTRAADAAASRADFATAVVERFRAIIRSLDERGLIEEYPGMTADESVPLAARSLGDCEIITRLGQGAELFDAVRYGRVEPSSQQDEWMRGLARDVTGARAPRARATAAPALAESAP